MVTLHNPFQILRPNHLSKIAEAGDTNFVYWFAMY